MSRENEERGRCARCHREVMGVSTQNGARMPLDFPPERRFVVDSGKSPVVARERNVYTCHLETCKAKP